MVFTLSGFALAESENADLNDITITETPNGIIVSVNGTLFEQIEKISWNGADVTKTVQKAIKDGDIMLFKEKDGFTITFLEAQKIGFEGDGMLEMETNYGDFISSFIPFTSLTTTSVETMSSSGVKAASSCSWLTFNKPTGNKVIQKYACYNCNPKAPNKYHTGVDYSYTTTSSGKTSSDHNAYVVAKGTVYKIEKKSSSDHGMGNNVIIEHTMSDCSKRYSTYSHLDSINSSLYLGKPVSGGDKVGVMGGSGYGSSTYYPKHLHFEMKTCGTSGTCNSYKGTCSSGCWGYTPYHPDNYGYKDPNRYGSLY